MLARAKDELAEDFIGNDGQTVSLRQRRQRLHLGRGGHMAGGVVWRDQDDRARAWGDSRGQRRRIHSPAG